MRLHQIESQKEAILRFSWTNSPTSVISSLQCNTTSSRIQTRLQIPHLWMPGLAIHAISPSVIDLWFSIGSVSRQDALHAMDASKHFDMPKSQRCQRQLASCTVQATWNSKYVTCSACRFLMFFAITTMARSLADKTISKRTSWDEAALEVLLPGFWLMLFAIRMINDSSGEKRPWDTLRCLEMPWDALTCWANLIFKSFEHQVSRSLFGGFDQCAAPVTWFVGQNTSNQLCDLGRMAQPLQNRTSEQKCFRASLNEDKSLIGGRKSADSLRRMFRNKLLS